MLATSLRIRHRNETAPARRLGYRPELDGIRGIAVLLVVVGHAKLIPALDTGGRFGVTLFFALSGYLITSLLMAETARTGRVDLRAFYVRRVRRLAPALIALVAVTGLVAIPLGHFLYPQQAMAALAYVSNLVGFDMGWLFHTWSLALEEQFYLVWPALFILVPRRWLAPSVLGVAVLAIALRSSTTLPSFHPLVRLDPIALGCLLALVRPSLPSWLGPVGWVAGIAAVVVNAPLTVETLAAVAIVATARTGWLSWRPLVRVGEISYGLYLWHLVPVLLLGPLGVPVAFALALASERWIERPWRYPRSHADERAPELGRVVQVRSGVL